MYGKEKPADGILKSSKTENKKVKFASIDDDHEGDWQTQEINRLNKIIMQLSSENSDLRSKLD